MFTGDNQQRATARIRAWRDLLALSNYFLDDPHMREAFAQMMSQDRFRAFSDRLSVTGQSTPNELAPLVDQYDRPDRHPQLEWIGLPGERYQEIRPNPLLKEARALVWGNGLIALSAQPGNSFEQQGDIYIRAQVGEAGILCPVACSMGLVRILRRRASEKMQDQYLPALLAHDIADVHIGAQFLTEIQGGSDVFANEVRASYIDGTWRIYGTKWFCSVVDADLYLITAQPDGGGKKGPAGFIVPREVDGKRNSFTIPELKDKSNTGTKSLATAVIDFDGAIAFPIGSLNEGPRNIFSDVLNMSRLVNIVGNAGMMRQAYRIAHSYAVAREAFRSEIVDYWDVRKDLALIKTEWLATLYAAVHLTSLDELVDRGVANKEELALYRFLINGEKFVAANACVSVLRKATGVLGGNGLIADFSILPRISRDADVLAQWEGPENVLAAQMFNDCRRLQLHKSVLDWVLRTAKKSDNNERLRGVVQDIADATSVAKMQMHQALEEPAYAGLNSKRLMTKIVRIVQATCLLDAARKTKDLELMSELVAASELLLQTAGIGKQSDHVENAEDAARVDAVLGKDPQRVEVALEAA